MKQYAIVLPMLLCACANPYSQFYKGMPDARVRRDYVHTSEELKIYTTDNFERDVQALVRKGFRPIGDSRFNANTNTISEIQLRDQAKKVGAHVVLVSSKFTHSVTGATPLTLPKTTTTYSTANANAYGPGGSVSAYGSGTTTTYGTETTYIPYTVNRADFSAVYFIKAKVTAGLVPEALDDDTRRRLERNSGVRVRDVIEGSSAFEADILPGDVLLSFNGQIVRSTDHYQQLLADSLGQYVNLVLSRNGREIEKRIYVRRL